MLCETFFNGLKRRLTEKMSIEKIGEEMCRGVKDPEGKIIRAIKKLYGKKADYFLRENKEWLGYTLPHNKTGKNKKDKPKIFGSEDNKRINESLRKMREKDDKYVIITIKQKVWKQLQYIKESHNFETENGTIRFALQESYLWNKKLK